jgi:hypothetical protein
MRINPFGDRAASVRLQPDTLTHLLRNFAEWADDALPQLDSVWDISRRIAAAERGRSSNPPGPSNHQHELMIGILEFCLSCRLIHLAMLAEHRPAERSAAYG